MGGHPGEKRTVDVRTEEGTLRAEIVRARGDEFYVHFVGFNRRLDRWVPRHELVLETLAETQPEHKKKEAEEKHIQIKNIDAVEIGRHRIQTWYFSPYPQQLCLRAATLYLCEFCLSYHATKGKLKRHVTKCALFHPPGNEVYRKDAVSVWELDGGRQRTYCERLCLFSKLFLDHKVVCYDTRPFMFYIFTQRDEYGSHVVGYFSKEKHPLENYNLSCILALPQYQKMGYGKMMIEFSYELSKKENKRGEPEKPLSDLGLLSYRSYWTAAVGRVLAEWREGGKLSVSIEDICGETGMTQKDVVYTLKTNCLLRVVKKKYFIVLNSAFASLLAAKKAQPRIDMSLFDFF
ncbi:MAG: histone acetyltransferase ESA1 [Amphiamblys sp. WSBS2006]|nr:MAG: histone acetyltransferase ESA1 [Amphiamblys sp. WSBS2006]